MAANNASLAAAGASPSTPFSAISAWRAAPASNSPFLAAAAPSSSGSTRWRATPKENSPSRSPPRADSTRIPAPSARLPAAAVSAVFPIPAGPVMSSNPPCPDRAVASSASIRESSSARSKRPPRTITSTPQAPGELRPPNGVIIHRRKPREYPKSTGFPWCESAQPECAMIEVITDHEGGPMTADTAPTATPAERWPDLPQLDVLSPEYQEDPNSFGKRAREQSPIAVLPFGLAALTYDAVQTVLRDKRFHEPEALGLATRGITSGPLWDRAAESLMSLNGER